MTYGKLVMVIKLRILTAYMNMCFVYLVVILFNTQAAFTDTF
jgi:hypothetical protein